MTKINMVWVAVAKLLHSHSARSVTKSDIDRLVEKLFQAKITPVPYTHTRTHIHMHTHTHIHTPKIFGSEWDYAQTRVGSYMKGSQSINL